MEASDFEWVYRNEANLPDFKKEMLEACKTGNLSQLQQIYQTHDIQPGAQLDWMEKDESPTMVFRLNVTAIIHEHVPILKYLLSMHPTCDLYYETVVLAIVDHPNLEMLDVIVKHQPDIINIQYRHTHTFLTDACQGGSYDSPPSDKTLPLIHYLLDHGADPRRGSWRDCGALCTALESKRSLEIIEKMMAKGATVDDFIFSAAIKGQRPDAVQLFFDRAILRGCSTKRLLKEARETGDKEMVSLVEAGIAKFTGQELPKWWHVWSLPFRPSRNYLYRPSADEQDEWDSEI